MSLPNDDKALAHLLRRTGFGWDAKEWANAKKLGTAALTRQLLYPQTVPDNLAQIQNMVVGDLVDLTDLNEVRQWWMFRMVNSSRPLHEKISLFWHQHFATANYKVDNPQLMWRQIKMFRENGLGSFRSLLLEVMKDPAMLLWLDGNTNRKGHANENFSRETMELFTMGPGNYTERDVRESARAYTGWIYDYKTHQSRFNPYLHDDGVKTFLGHTGNFQGEDIIEIIVRQPATAKFMSRKLWQFFVNPSPSDADLKPMEKAYFDSGYNISKMLEVLFTSTEFYAPQNRYACVKSPAEFVAIALKTLDAPIPQNVAKDTAAMGQDLLNPPSVKGWDTGENWINTNTLAARVEFTSQLIRTMIRKGNFNQQIETRYMGADKTPTQAVNDLWSALLPGRTLRPSMQTSLLRYVDAGKADQKLHPNKLPGLVNLVLGSPDYQLA